jgi:hypothetical protein
MQIAARFPDVKITVLNFACGGSKITDGLLFGWSGPEPALGAPNLPSQVAALEAYTENTSRSVDAIVMNIGGNDARFSDMIVRCIVIDPVNDCANDPLLKEVGELLKDDIDPQFPFPHKKAILRARYKVVDAVFRNAGGRAGLPGLVDARPDEVYLTGMANPSHDSPSNDSSPANPDDLCDGTQTQDWDYARIKRGEAEAIEDLVGGPTNSMSAAMKLASDRHGWIFIDTFDLARDHGVCADNKSFFRTNEDALRIQGDEGLASPLPGVGFISPGIVHQNEAGYAARADLIANVVGEQVRMRFRAPILSLNRVEAGTASKVTFSWNDPSPRHLPETRWELEVVKRGTLNPTRVFSDGSATLNGELTETPLASGRMLTWRVPESGEFTARIRGCRDTPTGFYCGPFSNAVTVVTYIPGTPIELKRLEFHMLAHVIGVSWTPARGTPTSVRYEVTHEPYGGFYCPPPLLPDICRLAMTIRTTSTTARIDSHPPNKVVFRVRACSTAGCSPYTPQLIIDHLDPLERVDMPGPASPPDLHPNLPDIAPKAPPRLDPDRLVPR